MKRLNSDKGDPPMWWVEISITDGDYKKVEIVDGFYALRENLEALYESMGYLNDEVLEELGTPDFEKKYGKKDV